MPEAALVPLVTASDEGGKPIIEWSDTPGARRPSSPGSCTDADAVLAAVGDQLALDRGVDEAIGLLALVAGQDVEPGETDGTWRIARKVAKDRVISTVDPEARHGHKSTAVRKDGFKAHLATEPDTGIVTAAEDHPGQRPRRAGRCRAHGRRARRPRGPRRLGLWLGGDPARLGGPTSHRLVIKPLPSRPSVPGGFGRDDFTVDHDGAPGHLPGRARRPALAKRRRQVRPALSGPVRSGPAARRPPPAPSACRPTTTSSWRHGRPGGTTSSGPPTDSTGRWPSARSPGSSPRGTDACAIAVSSATRPGCYRRVAALNLRRLLVLGLTCTEGTWVLQAV